MKYIIVLLLLLLISNSNGSPSSSSSFSSESSSESSYVSQYNLNRNALVEKESMIKVGYNTPFSTTEQLAGSIFSNLLTQEELKYSNVDPSSINFFQEMNFIENESTIFQILQKMPKGSALHVHSDSAASYDYLINVGSYLPNCYYYITEGEDTLGLNGTFHFFQNKPSDNNWKLLSDIRNNVQNVTEFDQFLINSITMVDKDYGDYIELWRKFQSIFGKVAGLVSYLPISYNYMLHISQSMIQDNVMHIELRKVFGDLYDLSGNTYNDTKYIEIVQDVVSVIRDKYDIPEFGIKLIMCNIRHSNQSFILENMIQALHLRNQYPDIVVGYDLVGAEDSGYPLYYFIDQFAQINEIGKSFEYPLDFYFHAGETILYNNTNLYDAILLNTKRIGHGVQLSQHPELMEIVLTKNIGIEVCPISNQILKCVDDMRSHPAFNLINQGLPVTISPDDPAIYGYNGLSFDFYEATYAWGLTLQQLKQLALNSIQQSALNSTELVILNNAWSLSWSNFIDYIIKNYQ